MNKFLKILMTSAVVFSAMIGPTFALQRSTMTKTDASMVAANMIIINKLCEASYDVNDFMKKHDLTEYEVFTNPEVIKFVNIMKSDIPEATRLQIDAWCVQHRSIVASALAVESLYEYFRGPGN